MILKWNSNISMLTGLHQNKEKIYGTLYGKVIVEEEPSFTLELTNTLNAKPNS
jgi:hypothetical protein